MENKKEHFRHLMLFYYRKGKTASQCQQKICAVYGENAVTNRACQKWFSRFRAGNFSLKDKHRTGRPMVTDVERINEMIVNNPRMTTRVMALQLNISRATVARQLKKLGYVNIRDVWVPHELSEANLIQRVSICDSLLRRNENDPFLERLVTGDEKWIVYNNVRKSKSWRKKGEPPLSVPKPELHQRKVMLCIWWDCKGILYYELLPNNETINSEKYCSQLDRLKAAIEEKRPELGKNIVFHHDNARPHTSMVTRQKLRTFEWDVLPQPPYSPDIAPSDFHLFSSLQNFLNGKRLTSLEDCRLNLEEFINQKNPRFWRNGIYKLPEKWQYVVNNNGLYCRK